MGETPCFDLEEVKAEVERLLRQGMKVAVALRASMPDGTTGPVFYVTWKKDDFVHAYVKEK